MTRLPIASRAWQLLALVPVALMSAARATTAITPDIIMATGLMLFLYQATDPRLLASKTRCFLCGVTAGAAYLAKAYALPFALALLLLAAVLRYLLQRRRGTATAAGAPPAVSLKGLAGAVAVAVLGFAPGQRPLDRRHKLEVWVPDYLYGGLLEPCHPESARP